MLGGFWIWGLGFRVLVVRVQVCNAFPRIWGRLEKVAMVLDVGAAEYGGSP